MDKRCLSFCYEQRAAKWRERKQADSVRDRTIRKRGKEGERARERKRKKWEREKGKKRE